MLNRNHSSLAVLGMMLACLSPVSGASAASPVAIPGAEKIDPPLFPALSYADTADLALRAPVVVVVQVAKATRLKGELAPDLSAGSARFLIEANVQSLLRGKDGLPSSVGYITDVPLDSRGKPPVLKKRRMILLADRVPGKAEEIRLVSARAQVDWSPVTESRLRAILTEANAPDAPPSITGVGRAFHVPGAVPGESETQIFLTTSDGRPVSLNVLRRPGEAPRWAVALAEIVDDAAAPPARDTLLWYRLACFLPRKLPDSAITDMDGDNAAAAAEDYAVVLAGLGACTRSL